MWRYEGCNTLAFYLRRRDGMRVLARDLGVPEDLVISVAMRQIFMGLSALHSAGLVHRCAASAPRCAARWHRGAAVRGPGDRRAGAARRAPRAAGRPAAQGVRWLTRRAAAAAARGPRNACSVRHGAAWRRRALHGAA
jgi:hypothetical protein